jgi:hypothetical protein
MFSARRCSATKASNMAAPSRATPLLLALLLGCGASAEAAADADPGSSAAGDGATNACMADNPPSEPFDVGDTQRAATPAPQPGGAPIVAPAPTAADIAQDCRDGGGCGCDEHSFISKKAAECLARQIGLVEGVRPWSTSLGYYQNHQRVGWGVMTVREYTSDGYWGEVLVLDATSGDELARESYRATP